MLLTLQPQQVSLMLLGNADSPSVLVVSLKAESANHFGGIFSSSPRTASQVFTIFIYRLGEVKDNFNTACAYLLKSSVSKPH